MNTRKVEMIERGVAVIAFLLLALLVACSGSSQRNQSVVDEENPQGASVSWDDAIFGTDYFADIEDSENFRFDIKPESRKTLINRGDYLVNSVAACGSCHGNKDSRLGGGSVIRDSFGEVVVPNISSDSETGIGAWSNAEIVRAVRESISKSNNLLSPDSHMGYRWISDTDAIAIAEYLKSSPAYVNNLERRELSSFDQKTLGIIEKNRDVSGYVPSPPQTETAEYGRYLAVQLAGCVRCHHGSEGWFSEAEPFSGNEEGFEYSGPDIRGKTGRLKDWSIDDYIKYLSNGVTPDGRQNDGKICPWSYYSKMTTNDKRAIAKLLKSL